jgi:hypothetical protein
MVVDIHVLSIKIRRGLKSYNKVGRQRMAVSLTLAKTMRGGYRLFLLFLFIVYDIHNNSISRMVSGSKYKNSTSVFLPWMS